MNAKKPSSDDIAFTGRLLREAVTQRGGKPPTQEQAERRVRDAVLKTERREAGG